MKVLNLLTAGGVGGIEILCKDIAINSSIENAYCFLFGKGLIYEQMKSIGIKVYSFDEKKISFEKIIRLIRIAFSYDIIVVHHDDPFLQMYYLMLATALPKKKYVSMVHHCYDPKADNLGYGVIKRTIKEYLVSRLFRKSDCYVFVSKAGRNSYIGKFAVDNHKSHIVYNGIGTEKLRAGASCQKGNHEKIHISYIGRLVELKGVDKFIQVIPSVLKKYDCCINIVGDGNYRSVLESMAIKLGVQKKIDFKGFQRDVTPFLSDTDIFVYPSKTEIFGISLVEAMAFNCICVASNVGGIPEIISNNVNGFLYNDNNIEDLKQALLKACALVSSGDRFKMAEAARMTAEKFSIENTVYKLERIYCKLLEG